LTRPSLARRCLAEAFATFALVFAGCGAIVANAERCGELGSNGIAITLGLVIMVMVYATGETFHAAHGLVLTGGVADLGSGVAIDHEVGTRLSP
jgi:major intrinsic protein